MEHDVDKIGASVARAPQYATGDEILFQHAGLLAGRVERVACAGRRVRYAVTATITFDVPESAVVGRESDVLGETEEEGGAGRGGRR